MERPDIRIFMCKLQTFFSAKSFHQVNESCNTFAAETLYNNHNVDYMLLMAASREELLNARDIFIFLLHNLGFLSSLKSQYWIQHGLWSF